MSTNIVVPVVTALSKGLKRVINIGLDKLRVVEVSQAIVEEAKGSLDKAARNITRACISEFSLITMLEVFNSKGKAEKIAVYEKYPNVALFATFYKEGYVSRKVENFNAANETATDEELEDFTKKAMTAADTSLSRSIYGKLNDFRLQSIADGKVVSIKDKIIEAGESGASKDVITKLEKMEDKAMDIARVADYRAKGNLGNAPKDLKERVAAYTKTRRASLLNRMQADILKVLNTYQSNDKVDKESTKLFKAIKSAFVDSGGVMPKE